MQPPRWQVRSHFLSQGVSSVVPRLILLATWQAGSLQAFVRRARGANTFFNFYIWTDLVLWEPARRRSGAYHG